MPLARVLAGEVVAVSRIGWALAYAEAGHEVLPLHTPTPTGCSCRRPGCESVGKHPRVMRGKDDATADPETVARWWSMWPDANIGIRPAPGVVVLDIDPRNGGGTQVVRMQRRYGTLPATRTARTGGGGLHIWYRRHGPTLGQLAPGVDIKTSSGYLVAPPSVHASGGRYEWIDPGDIVAAPAYLCALLIPGDGGMEVRPRQVRPPGKGATPNRVAGLLRVVTDAQEGERNSRLYWACRTATEHGIDLAPLVDAAVRRGLARREAETTAASATKTAMEVVC